SASVGDPAAAWAAARALPSAAAFLDAGEAWLERFPTDPRRAEVEAALVARRRAEPRWILPAAGALAPGLASAREALYVCDGRIAQRGLWSWAWATRQRTEHAVPPGLIDLQVLAAPSRQGLWAVQVRDGAKRLITFLPRLSPRRSSSSVAPAPPAALEDPAFDHGSSFLLSGDGRALLALAGERWLLCGLQPDGSLAIELAGSSPLPSASVRVVTLTPDGTHAVFAGRDPDEQVSVDALRVVRLADDAVVVKRMFTARVKALQGLPGGWFLVGTDIGQLIEADVRGERWDMLANPEGELIEFVGHKAVDGEHSALRWTPAGLLYAYGRLDRGGRVLQVWRLAERALVEEGEFPAYGTIQLSPDGRYLAGSVKDRVEVWDRWLPGEWAPR
ncbi:MAG: hypothetical protein KDD82_23020, partial [Planctomycetes bacterium]|nr:hypothetical protein [Planctomycetota bacterium]